MTTGRINQVTAHTTHTPTGTCQCAPCGEQGKGANRHAAPKHKHPRAPSLAFRTHGSHLIIQKTKGGAIHTFPGAADLSFTACLGQCPRHRKTECHAPPLDPPTQRHQTSVRQPAQAISSLALAHNVPADQATQTDNHVKPRGAFALPSLSAVSQPPTRKAQPGVVSGRPHIHTTTMR